MLEKAGLVSSYDDADDENIRNSYRRVAGTVVVLCGPVAVKWLRVAAEMLCLGRGCC